MQKSRNLFLCLLISLIGQLSYGQEDASTFKNPAFHQDIFNGVKYIPAYVSKNSHPFLNEQMTAEASIFYKGNYYYNLSLQYDIYAQLFVLNYYSISGIKNQIQLTDVYLDSVRIYNSIFIPNPYPTINSKYIQTIESGQLCILIQWWKKYELSGSTYNSQSEYTEAKRKMYLSKNKELYTFKSKHSLLKHFSPEKRSQVKSLIKQNQIKLKHADTEQLQLILNALNSLENN